MAPAEGEVSVHPAIGARRAGALHPAVQEVWAAAVHHGAVVEVPVAVVEVPVVAAGGAAVAVDAGKQNLEKNKGCRLVTDHWQLITDY